MQICRHDLELKRVRFWRSALRVVFCITLRPYPGLKPDGSIKIRPIDDMTVSMINAATWAKEKLSCDTLDLFFASMQRLEHLVEGPKKLWKADIDAAFRRIPIRKDHRQYAQIVLQIGEDVLTSQHLTMMFGSVSSVPLGTEWVVCCALWRDVCCGCLC